MKKALVVIDMQYDFVFGALGSADAQAILPNVAERIRQARQNGEQVIFTRDTHGADYATTQEGKKLPVAHCVKDTAGWEICEGLYQAGELVFDKPVFGSLELASYLQAQAFDSVEFIGVCTDICVVSNVLLAKATCLETEIFVRADCCAGVTKEKHAAALETMSSCQVTVL
jgi:nicotinamidase-related amidase